MAVAYGLFAMGLVLGWAALFLWAPTWQAISAQALWLGLIVALSMLSSDPWFAATGAAMGAVTHLLLQLGLEARHA